jgi:hypothetical protein
MVREEPGPWQSDSFSQFGGLAMKHRTLGPHTFMSPPHERHPAWLKSFPPRERHQLIEDDRRAGRMAIGIITSAILFGLTMLIVVLVFAM